MKKNVKIVIVCLFLALSAQLAKAQASEATSIGIHFEQGLNWQQVLDKAKAEHKYIFVDCYATWCGPCKEMDANVYPLKEVGDAYNGQFICVKLQMDKTGADNEGTKSWYMVADKFTKNFTVNAFPTFLFFSPDGMAIHKQTGSSDAAKFIKFAADVQDPTKQFYTQLDAYQSGKRDYANMPGLVKMAGKLDDETLALQVAGTYMNDYLDHLSEDQFLNKENLLFMQKNPKIIHPSDRVFQLCYHHAAKADTAMHNKDFAYNLVNQVINQEEVWPKTDEATKTGIEPDWATIANNIKNYYGRQYVKDILIDAKFHWYEFKGDRANYAKYLTMITARKIKRDGMPNGPVAQLFFNNNVWSIFQYDKDKSDLEQALKWMHQLNSIDDKPNPGALDTEANLLYKLDKKAEAIRLETQAVQLSNDDKDIAGNLEKMQNSKPTW